MGILSWAARFKNVRCVLLLDPAAAPPEEKLAWLVRKHRYRQVGVNPGLLQSPPSERLLGRPFVPLQFPHDSLAGLAAALHDEHPPWLADTLVLALAHAAPLLTLDEGLAPLLAPFSPWLLRAAQPLPEGEIIRHLRISGYVCIDFFHLAEKAWQALRADEAGALARVERERRRLATADGRKRFWRIEGGEEGRPVVAYIDLLPSLVPRRERIASLLAEEYTGLALSLTTAFFA